MRSFVVSKTNIKIAIKSSHRYADRRQAQYDTWLQELDEDFFFVVGDPKPSGSDMLYARGCSDEFANIAPKVLLACQYALSESVTHLLVLDDDTYLRPERALASGFEAFDAVGFVRNNGPCPYLQGSCFWLSQRAMEAVVEHSDFMVNGVPDDVAVGRCLTAEGIHLVHEHRFSIGEPYVREDREPRCSNNIIACHKCLPPTMRRVHSDWLLSQKESK